MGKYIHNVATTFIGQMRITPADLVGEFTTGPQSLYEKKAAEIKSRLIGMKPETLGKIAAEGRGYTEAPRFTTSLYLVHCGSYCGKYESGRSLLIEIATTAIVAEMTDILWPRKGQEVKGGGRTLLHQQDAPSCSDCGAIMIRNGACYKCLNCGATSGCS